MKTTFMLDSSECTLIAALEEHPSLNEVSAIMGRDPSVLSRQLSKIIDRYPVAEKQAGRWKLTPMGKKIAEWTRKTSFEQAELLNEKTQLRIGSTREFSSRLLSSNLNDLQNKCPNVSFYIDAFEKGVEDDLLKGTIDIGIDCGQPNDPLISYKRILPEPFVIVAREDFWKNHNVKKKEDLIGLPYYRYSRLNYERYLQISQSLGNPTCIFNDIASLREALLQDNKAWALLPRYTVWRELSKKRLTALPFKVKTQESYGVWHLRSRTDLKNIVGIFENWLRKQSL